MDTTKQINELTAGALSSLELSQTTTKVSRTCCICNKEFPTNFRGLDFICDDCERQRRAERQAEIEHRRQVFWFSLCPGEYREIDFEKLPNRKSYVTAMSKSGSSLLLHGVTGRGKTRCAWQIVKADFFSGRSIVVLDSTAGIKFAGKFGTGADEVERWMNQIIHVDTVLLDDVFKSKITEAFDAFLYAIVDQRVANGRKIICTCNDTGQTLSERLSQDRAEPFIRRLREHCHAITF